LKQARWNPYLVGAGIGVLSWVTFGLMGKALGASTSMVRASGAAVGVVSTEAMEANAYFAKYLGTSADGFKPVIDWQMALVLAAVLGAFIAWSLSGRVRDAARLPTGVPAIWARRFGPSRGVRLVGAFVGGAVMLFGARMAGGCTSGHGISGVMQMSAGSLMFVAGAFGVGIPFALALYGRRDAADGQEVRGA